MTNDELLKELSIANARIAELEDQQRRCEDTFQVLKSDSDFYLKLAKIILVELDVRETIVKIGGSCYDILGYQPDELVGKKWSDICLPVERHDNVIASYEKLISGNLEGVEYTENSVLTKSGRHVHVAWRNAVLRNEAGDITGVLSAGADITERKNIEVMLKANEAQFNSIIDSSPVPYLLSDESRNITYLNSAFVETFGYSRQDILVLEDWWRSAYPDSDYLAWVRSAWRERIKKTETLGLPFEPLEVAVRCKDGSRRTVLVSAAILTGSFFGKYLVMLYDITERKQAENALRQSERKYRLLFENMTSGFALHEIICNEQGEPINYRYLELNPAFEKLTGVSADALLGKTIRDVLPDTEDYWIEIFGKVAITGESIAYENYSRELGKYYDTWVFSPQKNQFAVIFSDITERKKAEEALREGDKYFRALFDQSSFGVAKLDSQSGKFLKVNQRYCDLLGYTVEEMCNLDVQSITHEDEFSGNTENLTGFQNGSASQLQVEKQYRHKDGSVVWVALSILPLWEKGDEHDFHLAIVEDITERKLAEAKLQQQKDEQQQIINAMVDAVISFDEHGSILTFNRSAELMFGYELSEVINKNVKLLLPSSLADSYDSYISGYLQTGDNQLIGHPGEAQGRRKNNEIFPMRLSVAELPKSADGVRRFIGSCQDLTVQKQQEEQLRRTQKMDALGKLTGGIAHDYNNTMGIILGYAEILQDALAGNTQLRKYVDEIYRASERGTKLSHKLLTFSRNKQPEAGVVNINSLLSGEKDLLEKTLTPRIELNLELGQDVWPVYVDSGDLEDAILNLVINAMHAIQSDGRLTITTRNIHIAKGMSASTNLNEGDYVVLTVEDTGTGMDIEIQSKIFDPFFTTKGDQGVGLGLSMVYGFVQRSGGDIVVSSSPGRGSQFALYLPRCDDAIPETTTGKTREGMFRGDETILVVDDEPALTNLVQELMTARGYTVYTASDGNEALRLLADHKVDLLLTDIIMPGMNGYQLASKVQNQYPAVKIQLVSGFADDRQLETMDSGLVQSLLRKPFSATALLRRVRELLDDMKPDEQKKIPKIMVLDDDENVRELFRINLEKLGYQAVLVSSGEDAIVQYRQSMQSVSPVDLAIMDLAIGGGMSGVEVAKKILELDGDANLVVSSGDSYGPVMTNYRKFGFKGAIEKTFNRRELERVVCQIIFSE